MDEEKGISPKRDQEAWNTISRINSEFADVNRELERKKVLLERLNKELQIEVARRIEVEEELRAMQLELEDRNAKLREYSLTDELTGLSNRRSFYLLAEQQIKSAKRQKQKFVLFSADMDGLKSINDTWGHQAGDLAIVAIADILRASLRSVDIVARLGGDEYAGVLMETDTQEAAAMLERLADNVTAWNRTSGKPYALSVSIGLAEYDPQQPAMLEQLIALADRRMYEAKNKKHGNARGLV